jgi:hypothetical protein
MLLLASYLRILGKLLVPLSFHSVTRNILDFNKWITQPLGTIPQLRVTLGGKIVYLDVMVVHDPLDFNFLLARDYVYAMKDLVSALFRVMCFHHNGNIVTI